MCSSDLRNAGGVTKGCVRQTEHQSGSGDDGLHRFACEHLGYSCEIANRSFKCMCREAREGSQGEEKGEKGISSACRDAVTRNAGPKAPARNDPPRTPYNLSGDSMLGKAVSLS